MSASATGRFPDYNAYTRHFSRRCYQRPLEGRLRASIQSGSIEAMARWLQLSLWALIISGIAFWLSWVLRLILLKCAQMIEPSSIPARTDGDRRRR